VNPTKGFVFGGEKIGTMSSYFEEKTFEIARFRT
jgi:hypothetical protein